MGTATGILGAIVFLLMPTVVFVHLGRFAGTPGWRWLWLPTLVLGTITAVADIVFSVATKVPDLIAVAGPWDGLLQRLAIIPFMVWVAIFATGLLRRDR